MQNPGKNPAYNADQDRADYGPGKTIHVETLDQGRYQPEHQPVYNQQEKTKGQQSEGESEEDQNGPDDGIDNSQEERHQKGGCQATHPDHPWQEVGNEQNGRHVNQ
jgi:hypothetical protein